MSFVENVSVEVLGGLVTALTSGLISMYLKNLKSKKQINNQQKIIDEETQMIKQLQEENSNLKDYIAKLESENRRLKALTQTTQSIPVSELMTESQARVYDYITSIFGNASTKSSTWFGWPEDLNNSRSRHDVMLDRLVAKNIILRLNFSRDEESAASKFINSLGLEFTVDSSGSSNSYVRLKIKLPLIIGDTEMHIVRSLISYAFNTNQH